MFDFFQIFIILQNIQIIDQMSKADIKNDRISHEQS